MRSRAPPVADAARRSTRSGRKNRASEQREDFFGYRKADGANAPAATLGAYLCAVRTMLQHRSYPALQATERGSSRGNLSPLTVFWFLLYAQKERLRGERCLLCLCKRLHGADRRDEIWCKGGRGGWGAGRRLAEGAVLQTIKYLLNCHLSSPPQRRGQGWWFALPRSSAGR